VFERLHVLFLGSAMVLAAILPCRTSGMIDLNDDTELTGYRQIRRS